MHARARADKCAHTAKYSALKNQNTQRMPHVGISNLRKLHRRCHGAETSVQLRPPLDLRGLRQHGDHTYGLDGRPLCVSCQDPSYAHYLTARTGIIVQDYLNVCHRTSTAPSAHTTPALLALASLLPQDPRNGQLFQPTRWSDIVVSVHALAKLVAR